MIAGYAALERQVADLHREFRALQMQSDETRPSRRSALDIAAALGMAPDPWQIAPLTRTADELILASRQAGKGFVASMLALEMLEDPGSTTVIIAKAERQAKRLLRRIKRQYRKMPEALASVVDSAFAFELANGSEIQALPGSEETVRGIEAVDLLIIDEAALVPDELVEATFPMLATTNGRCVALSTARGRRGWFWREWSEGGDTWERTKVTAYDIPRIRPEYLEKARQRFGQWVFDQEFMVEFLDAEDSYFPSALIDSIVSVDVKPIHFPFTWGAAA